MVDSIKGSGSLTGVTPPKGEKRAEANKAEQTRVPAQDHVHISDEASVQQANDAAKTIRGALDGTSLALTSVNSNKKLESLY